MRWLGAILVLMGVCAGVLADADVPLPRPRPTMQPAWVEPHSFAEAVAGLDLDAVLSSAPTPCDQRLAAMAAIELLPRLIGPGACGGSDMIELSAVLLPDRSRIAIEPAAMLNCAMAESVAAWLRDEVAPDVAKLGSTLTAVENYDSYECRTRNRLPGAKLSEHAHGEALDVRAFHLADGRRLELTDVKLDKLLRVTLRDSACHRFTTVLGPGDPFHNGHIHLDVIQRRSGYRICEWEVRAPAALASAASAANVPLPAPRPSGACRC